MTSIFFVRHAEPEHSWEDDRSRPLTAEGLHDANMVAEFFKSLGIDAFYCSPYLRSIQTIKEAASYHNKEIIIDERLREREKGPEGNHHGMFQKRWENMNYHEQGGESINMVQTRNIAALNDIISSNDGQTIVVGTHGTALSSIMHYYENTFDCNSFLRIIDWMPYIVELKISGNHCVEKTEHLYLYKEFKGNSRPDKSSQP